MVSVFHAPRFRQRLAALSTVLAWSIVWIGSLQYAPSAHADLHHDAHDEEHHCVVEVFNEGVLSDAPEASVHTPATRIETEHQLATLFRPEPASRLRPPGRAPPIG